MVNQLSFMGMFFTLLVVLITPLILAILLYRRYRYRISSIFIGSLVFFVTQILIRLPLLSVISLTDWHRQNSNNVLFLLLVYALSAGVFEESGRFLGFRFLRKNNLDWKNAVAFGIGHAGIEALVLTGLTTLNNLIISLLINTGSFATLIAPALGEQADTVYEALISTPSSHFFLAGIERLAVFPIHILFSVIVCLAVAKGKPLLLILAIILHGLVNAPAALMSYLNLSVWVVEGILILMAAIAIIAALKQKKYFPENISEKPLAHDVT